MTKGIRFEVPNQWGTYLSNIFCGIDLSASDIYLSEVEAYTDKMQEHLMKLKYPYEQFLNGLQTHCYVLFMTMQAFPKGEQARTVMNYGEFLHSNCQMVMLVCDVSYVDIYVKDQHILETIKKNAEQSGFERIDFLTEENDIYKEFRY